LTRGGLALLLLASVAAGVWLFAREPHTTTAPTPCASTATAEEGACGAVPAGEAAQDNGETAAPAKEATRAKAPESPPDSAEEAGAEATPPPVAKAPPSAEEIAAWREEAWSLLKSGDLRGGIHLLERAVEADPTPQHHGELGRILRDATAIDQALYHLSRAAELDPGNADRWIELANAWYRKPDPGKAWAAERRAREAEPDLRLRRGPDGLWQREGDTATTDP
jgi:tetratricopeptide (TPR) repeat protein